MENFLKIESHEILLIAEKKFFLKLLVIPVSEQISSSVGISEPTSDVSTVLVSLTSTFLIISEEVLHAEAL